MNKKYYIVQEIGYEYNDEGYDKQEGGEPVKIFANKNLAERHADELTYKKIIGTSEILTYGYDVVKDAAAIAEILNKLGKGKFDEDDIRSYDFEFPDLTYKQYLQIKPYLDIDLYEVCECEGDMDEKDPPKTTKTSILRQVELEHTNGRNAFWRGTLYSNLDVVTEWGAIGSELNSKEFEGAGEEFLEKKIKEKLRGGYTEK